MFWGKGDPCRARSPAFRRPHANFRLKAELRALDINPKRQRGNDLLPSLARPVGSNGREQYIIISPSPWPAMPKMTAYSAAPTLYEDWQARRDRLLAATDPC